MGRRPCVTVAFGNVSTYVGYIEAVSPCPVHGVSHVAVLQVGRACASLPQCFFYRLEDRPTSLQALGAMPGVRATVSGLGYDSFADFAFEARKAIEAANALAAFCLTPPGDTPKRKGFYDAIMFGCCLLAHFKLSMPMSRFA